MILTESRLRGAYTIDIERLEDERGFFARIWSTDEFEALGLDTRIAQSSVAYNERRGTLRGLHFQNEPHAETKVVRCTRGAIYDVIVDLRPDSTTFRDWIALELSEENRRGLYVPKGFAHGYQTLAASTEVWYQMSTAHAPAAARGVRWDDPALEIEWPPTANRIMSARDAAWPDLQPPDRR